MATFSVGWEASDSKGGFDGFASASPVFRVRSSRNVLRTIRSTCPMIGDIDGHKSGPTFGHRFSHSKDGYVIKEWAKNVGKLRTSRI